MNDEVQLTDAEKLASDETVTFTVKRYALLTGARKITAVADLAECPADLWHPILDYWAGVRSQRASAQGCETLREKESAERIALDQCATFKWRPGSGGGGGSRLSLDDRAEREVFTELWKSQGLSETAAKKKVTGDKIWYDFFLSALCREHNTTTAKADEVEAAIEKNREYIEARIAEVKARMIAEDERTAELKAGLKF